MPALLSYRVTAATLLLALLVTPALAQAGADIRVWNGDVLAPHYDLIYGGKGGPLGPVTLVGARGGAFSGEVVVGSTRPIRGLKATVGDLAHAGGAGRIPSSAVQVRYPSLDILSDWNAITKGVPHFDALKATPPREVPLLTRQPGKRTKWATLNHACQPVWVTVNVPADAKAGDYKGTLKLTLGPKALATVPVQLKVHDYRLPDPDTVRTCVDFVQSPETVAMYYEVPLWSEKHFELMGKSLELLAKAGNRSINLHLVCETNHGNAQSMVRWIKQPDGAYTHDFVPLEKYLDLAVARMGKPRMVFVYVWDYQYNERKEPEGFKGCVEASTGEVKVSVLDARGKVTTTKLPKYTAPASKALWKPVIDGVMDRLRKRGLEKSALLGWATDRPPSNEIIALFAELAPGVPWAVGSHSFWSHQDRVIAKAGSPVKFATLVAATRYLRRGRFKTNFFAWKEGDLITTAYYRGMRDNHAITNFRFVTGQSTSGGIRGVGRIGGDFWPVLKDKYGRRRGTLSARYPESGWRNLDIRMTLLAPGPDGAIATTRLEMFREGLQECETRLFIEEALLTRKISGDLAKRCKALLAERTRILSDLGRARDRRVPNEQKDAIFQTFVDANWQTLTDRLYAAAAEAAKAIGER